MAKRVHWFWPGLHFWLCATPDTIVCRLIACSVTCDQWPMRKPFNLYAKHRIAIFSTRIVQKLLVPQFNLTFRWWRKGNLQPIISEQARKKEYKPTLFTGLAWDKFPFVFHASLTKCGLHIRIRPLIWSNLPKNVSIIIMLQNNNRSNSERTSTMVIFTLDTSNNQLFYSSHCLQISNNLPSIRHISAAADAGRKKHQQPVHPTTFVSKQNEDIRRTRKQIQFCLIYFGRRWRSTAARALTNTNMSNSQTKQAHTKRQHKEFLVSIYAHHVNSNFQRFIVFVFEFEKKTTRE